jgi:hypothetical protein
MSIPIATQRIAAGPTRRHWARVIQFSSGADRLLKLDEIAVDDASAEEIVADLCRESGVPEPKLKFHARRSPYTGACERPRSGWVDILGEAEVVSRERNGWGILPPDGAIRLGRTTTLMTLAHELGHHLVFHLEPPSTPAHGRVWVGRFDEAASWIQWVVVSDGVVVPDRTS